MWMDEDENEDEDAETMWMTKSIDQEAKADIHSAFYHSVTPVTCHESYRQKLPEQLRPQRQPEMEKRHFPCPAQ